MAVNSSKHPKTSKLKQIDFVSRLTFVRGLKDAPERLVYVERTKEKRKKKFKHWCMPEQPVGYMKCRMHDFF